MELKRCPHCGGKANIIQTYHIKEDLLTQDCDYEWGLEVKCVICGARSKWFKTEGIPSDMGWDVPEYNYAIEAWNMRVEKE